VAAGARHPPAPAGSRAGANGRRRRRLRSCSLWSLPGPPACGPLRLNLRRSLPCQRCSLPGTANRHQGRKLPSGRLVLAFPPVANRTLLHLKVFCSVRQDREDSMIRSDRQVSATGSAFQDTTETAFASNLYGVFALVPSRASDRSARSATRITAEGNRRLGRPGMHRQQRSGAPFAKRGVLSHRARRSRGDKRNAVRRQGPFRGLRGPGDHVQQQFAFLAEIEWCTALEHDQVVILGPNAVLQIRPLASRRVRGRQ
jgi:hypothetical protein